MRIVVRQFSGSRFPALVIDLSPIVKHLVGQSIVLDIELIS